MTVAPWSRLVTAVVFAVLAGDLVGPTPASAVDEDGSLDSAFSDVYAGSASGLNDTVYGTAVQSDGKIVVGGGFSSYYDGGTGVQSGGLARFNADGSLDTAFSTAFAGTAAGINGQVKTVAVQPDGKIVVAGAFSSYNNGSGNDLRVNGLARFNSDGTLDTSFTEQYAGTSNPSASGRGLGNLVNSAALQADGRIVVVGGFSSYDDGSGANSKVNKLARFNSDGSLDSEFSSAYAGSGVGLATSASAVAVQADGKILVGGAFASYDDGSGANTKVSRVARFTATGTLDGDFATTYAGTSTGLNVSVAALAVQPDGKILVGGDFTSYNTGSGANSKVNKLARFNPDGSLDGGFTTSYAGTGPGLVGAVLALAVQSDSKILIGGSFSSYNDGSGANGKVNKLARFNAAGTLDTGFTTAYAGTAQGLANMVRTVQLDATGRILVGGNFTSYDDGSGSNSKVNKLARFFGSPLVQTITFPPLADTALDATAPVPTATASSGLPVEYSSDSPGVCTVSGAITMLAAGTCSITARQPGNDTFLPAEPVTRSFQVTSPPSPSPTAPPTPSPTVSPTPSPSPVPRTSLRVVAKPAQDRLVAGRPALLVRRVVTDGTVSARVTCTVGDKPRPRLCDVKVPRAASAQPYRVVVTPKCSERLTVRVAISARRSDARRTNWERSWRVARHPFVMCTQRGTG